MVSSFSHIAFLVSSADESSSYLKSLGFDCGPAEVFESEGTKEVYVGSYEKQSGLLLLLEAISEGPYKRAMKKRGPSLHHIAINVSNVIEFSSTAQSSGWKLHPISQQTIGKHKTAWLYLEGIPTLIEVNEGELLGSSLKVSEINIPISNESLSLFGTLGLKDIVGNNDEGIWVVVDGQKLLFSQIACVK